MPALSQPDAPLRDRVRATAAVLSVSTICLFYRQQVGDPDKLRASCSRWLPT